MDALGPRLERVSTVNRERCRWHVCVGVRVRFWWMLVRAGHATRLPYSCIKIYTVLAARARDSNLSARGRRAGT
eukprot:3450666-Prymnesium_polylepis.1